MRLNNEKETTRFIRFAIVGLTGAIVDFGILNLLTLVFNVPFVTASVISFIAAVLNNFFLNHFWTYPDSRSKPLSQQLVQFALINLIGLLIRTPLLAWLENILVQYAERNMPIDLLSPVIIGHNVALAIAISIVMMWNYVANRLWTFNDIN